MKRQWRLIWDEKKPLLDWIIAGNQHNVAFHCTGSPPYWSCVILKWYHDWSLFFLFSSSIDHILHLIEYGHWLGLMLPLWRSWSPNHCFLSFEGSFENSTRYLLFLTSLSRCRTAVAVYLNMMQLLGFSVITKLTTDDAFLYVKCAHWLENNVILSFACQKN